MRQKLLLALTLLCASCSNYRSNFDCPAYPGVGCRSVSQIESMIVEHEHGSDCFLESCARHHPPLAYKKTSLPELHINKSLRQRIWICPHTNEEGHYIDGHYIYFGPEVKEKFVAISEIQK